MRLWWCPYTAEPDQQLITAQNQLTEPRGPAEPAITSNVGFLRQTLFHPIHIKYIYYYILVIYINFSSCLTGNDITASERFKPGIMNKNSFITFWVALQEDYSLIWICKITVAHKTVIIPTNQSNKDQTSHWNWDQSISRLLAVHRQIDDSFRPFRCRAVTCGCQRTQPVHRFASFTEPAGTNGEPAAHRPAARGQFIAEQRCVQVDE